MSELRIQPEPEYGRIRVFISSRIGPVSYTINGRDGEFIKVAPDGEAFTYRGRQYTGEVVLTRKDFKPASGYQFMVKDVVKGVTISQAAYLAISGAVSEAVAEHVRVHPQVEAEGERYAARSRAVQVAAEIHRMEAELDKLRAEYVRLTDDQP